MNVIFIHEENNYDLLIYEIIHTYDARAAKQCSLFCFDLSG